MNKKGFTLAELWVLIVMLGLIFIIFIQPYFEMKSFNKFSKGEKATYRDAFFSQLRIVNQ